MCTAGLSARNVERAMEVVLKELVGIEVNKLPKTTFANYMLLEARMVAQIQVADELTRVDFSINADSTLHSDGTSKKGHSYQTDDIQINDGTTLVAGLRCVGGGDAQTQLDTFKEVINGISDSIIKDKDNSHFKNIFSFIKNLMSDHCATQKKFNRLFTEFCSSIRSDVISNWNSLSVLEQQKLKTVNDFYCGLHFLVALGDQAEASLKMWESF